MHPYPYDFRPTQKSINYREVFVVMPFDVKYDAIYFELIVPACKVASQKLNLTSDHQLIPYRAKDDIRTVAGWINVLEHLTTAQIVLGVLTDDNPNNKIGDRHLFHQFFGN